MLTNHIFLFLTGGCMLKLNFEELTRIFSCLLGNYFKRLIESASYGISDSRKVCRLIATAAEWCRRKIWGVCFEKNMV